MGKSKVVKPAEKVPIAIDDVLGMIKNGKTREEVAAHYGLNRANMTVLFKHEKLKGVKTKGHTDIWFDIVEPTGAVNSGNTKQAEVSSSDGTTNKVVAEAKKEVVTEKENW